MSKKKQQYNYFNRGTLLGIGITLILGISLFAYGTMVWDNNNPGPPGGGTLDEGDVLYRMKVTIASPYVIPHTENYFECEFTLEYPLIKDNVTIFTENVEHIFLWQQDVNGTYFSGTTDIFYSLNLLEDMSNNEFRISITEPVYPFEVVVWNIGNADRLWLESDTFEDGPLAGQETWGKYHHIAISQSSGIDYVIYFELGL